MASARFIARTLAQVAQLDLLDGSISVQRADMSSRWQINTHDLPIRRPASVNRLASRHRLRQPLGAAAAAAEDPRVDRQDASIFDLYNPRSTPISGIAIWSTIAGAPMRWRTTSRSAPSCSAATSPSTPASRAWRCCSATAQCTPISSSLATTHSAADQTPAVRRQYCSSAFLATRPSQ